MAGVLWRQETMELFALSRNIIEATWKDREGLIRVYGNMPESGGSLWLAISRTKER